MALRILALLLLLGLSLATPTRAQDGSSVYSVNRSGSSASGPMQWIFGARPARTNPHIIRVAPEARREAPARTYQPRRRSTYAARPQPGYDRPGPAPSAQPLTPAPGDAPPADGTAPKSADTPGGVPAAPSAAPSAPAAAPEAPAVALPTPARPPVQIGIIGDSLSIFLAQGMQESYADRPHITFIRRHREASGLVRDDYFDWPKQFRDLIATSPRLDAVLIQIGSNDRQQIRDADGVHEPRSERWKDLYLKRIDDITAIAREKKIPLIWVGIPPMRGERYSADMLAITDLYKARTAAAQGVAAYIDIWEAFAGEDGTYAVNGPDVEGTIVRLRTADGVHFTKAGARKLAFFADKELKKIIAAAEGRAPLAVPAAIAVAAPAPAPGPAAPQGPTTIVLPELPEPNLPAALKSTDTLLGVPVPEAPLPTRLRARPQQGPVVSLNAAPVASGGALMPARPAASEAELFRSGLPGAMKSGRADDFRLPPN